ncbi:hypothetical protein R8G63_08940 [Tenacibaculum maritimum]|uniref:hypothetical protein n=3 Tax=Tenacibaculum maritimum TaxID=107401 RepID=UPI00388FB234
MPYFIPLGIPDFKGKKDRDFIQVSYLIEGNDAVELTIQIRDGGKIIYQEKITDSSKLTKGEHRWKWNGFDSNGIYDSAVFTTAKDLNIYTIAIDNEENYSRKRVEFTAKYSEVKWVDVKINKNTKRIDVTLRVNLKDGGEIGTEKDCTQVGSGQYSSIKTVCPWEKIPEKDIKPYQPLIKSRTKSFEELKEMALNGVNIHWSRRYTNTDGTIINNDNWEVIVTAVNTTKNAMDDLDIVFNTNSFWGRSNNPGNVSTITSFFANLAEYIPYVPLNETIYYNVGYVNTIYKHESHFFFKKDEWDYLNPLEPNLNNDFLFTSAHELGHSVLKAFAEKGGGDTDHSYKHKGSSDYSNTKPVNEGGENYPSTGEIDLMKYYNNSPYWSDFNRIVASQEDILGLIWLTKLELK